MNKYQAEIELFFDDIKNGKYQPNEMREKIKLITNGFVLSKLITLQKDFQKYFKNGLKNKSLGSSIEEKMQLYQLYADKRDPEFSFCYIFDSLLNESIAKYSNNVQMKYESEIPPKLIADSLNLTEPKSERKGSFGDIFVVKNWKKYIDALHKVTPPLIDGQYTFIGKPRNGKGVICSWIKHLQTKGKIKKSLNRQELSAVLNDEIKGLNLGKHGKTFDNYSSCFEEQYKEKLEMLIR